MMLRSYEPTTYKSLPHEDIQYGISPRHSWAKWERIVGPTMGDTLTWDGLTVEKTIALAGAKPAPNPIGNGGALFVIFPGRDASLIIDAHHSMLSRRTQHGQWSNLAQVVVLSATHADAEMTDAEIEARHSVVDEFALGLDGLLPDPAVVDMAESIVRAAIEQTEAPDFLVDFDGALSLDLRMSNGLRVLAELTIAGELDVGFYDDNVAEGAQEVKYLPEATAEELVGHLDLSIWQYHRTT